MTLTFGAPRGGWDSWKDRAAKAEKAILGTGPNGGTSLEDGTPLPAIARPAPPHQGFIYLGGPMRGIPEFNFPAFDKAANMLRHRGWAVLSPADHDREVLGREVLEDAPGYAQGDVQAWAESTGFSFAAAMQWDLAAVIQCDAIALLPGWQQSTGARYERAVAEACGRAIYCVSHALTGVYPDVPQKRLIVLEGK